MRLLLTLLLLLPIVSHAQIMLDSTIVNVDLVVDVNDGLVCPWDLEWGPDDHLWFTDAYTIKRYDPQTQQLDVVQTKPGWYAMSLGFHPDFPAVPEVFVAWDSATYYGNGAINTYIYKYQYDLQNNTLGQENYLFHYRHYGEHSGGRLVITQDYKLLVGSADYNFDFSAKMGKIHRINLDGSIPTDNPWPGNTTWTYGHRNPQGMVQLPSGRIYSSEHGMGGPVDEVNEIIKGENYGWPALDALYCHVPDSCNSPTFNPRGPVNADLNPHSGITWYDHPSIPEFQSTLLVGTHHSWNGWGGIRALRLNAAGDTTVSANIYLNDNIQNYGRVRDAVQAPDGRLFFICFDRTGLFVTLDSIYSEAEIRVLYNPNFVGKDPEILEELPAISMTPNPFDKQLRLRIAESYFLQFEQAECSLYDVKGERVHQRWVTTAETDLEVDLTPGVYFYQIRTPGGQSLKYGKLIRE